MRWESYEQELLNVLLDLSEDIQCGNDIFSGISTLIAGLALLGGIAKIAKAPLLRGNRGGGGHRGGGGYGGGGRRYSINAL